MCKSNLWSSTMNSRLFSLAAFCFFLYIVFLSFFLFMQRLTCMKTKKDFILLPQKGKGVKNMRAKEEKVRPIERTQEDVERHILVSKAMEALVLL